jgi:hypothetical protein
MIKKVITMKFEELRNIIEQYKAKESFLFDSKSDPLATIENISIAQEKMNIIFPEEYVDFLTVYGGGDFAFTNIISAYPNSYWYVVTRNEQAALKQYNFVAISDDETGGYYGFITQSGICQKRIYYWDHDGQEVILNESYESLFEYIVKIGLNQE